MNGALHRTCGAEVTVARSVRADVSPRAIVWRRCDPLWPGSGTRPATGRWGPQEVAARSGTARWWQCDAGHEWKVSPDSRFHGAGCPTCAGLRPSAERNLETAYPVIAAQWHPVRNGELTASEVSPSSARTVWWRCVAGHEWEAAPATRANGRGCPDCVDHSYRAREPLAVTHPDVAAQWDLVLNGDLDPQQVTHGSHRRVWWRCAAGHRWQAQIKARARRVGAGTGCPSCSGRIATPERNLATAHPEVAAQWHPTANGDLTPAQVSPAARRLVWWLCAAGHQWEALVINRAQKGSGCPSCTGTIATAARNLVTEDPDLAAQWHPTRNGQLRPQQLTPGSSRAVWWQCDRSHEWTASVVNRRFGSGCPVCAARGPAAGPCRQG